MRRNSNYFGDLSQFFLRAKKEENFELDEKIKNELREKLSLKINEIKNPQIEKATEPVVQPIIEETIIAEKTTGNFWTQWKHQLIGVPASLFALVMIVFAANNFNFELKPDQNKTDLSTKTENSTDLQTSLLDTSKPQLTEDSALISEALTDQPTNKPELLILDINKMGQSPSGEIRTLNKYEEPKSDTTTTQNNNQTQTTTSQLQTKPNTPQTAVTTTDSSVTQQTSDTTKTSTTTPTASQPQNQNTSTTQANPLIVSTSGTQQQTPPSAATISQTTPLTGGGDIQNNTNSPVVTGTNNTVNLTTNLPENQLVAPQETTAETTTVNKLLNDNTITAVNSGTLITTTETVPLTNYIKSSNILIETVKNREFSINYYKNSTSKSQPLFDKSIITEITSNKTPTAVNVYYISKTQVLVEVVEGTTKKLYLYENKDGAWTVIKYEKN